MRITDSDGNELREFQFPTPRDPMGQRTHVIRAIKSVPRYRNVDVDGRRERCLVVAEVVELPDRGFGS